MLLFIDFYEAFEMYDMNSDGKITSGELREVMRSLGRTLQNQNWPKSLQKWTLMVGVRCPIL